MSCACPPFVRVCTGSGTTLYDPFTRTETAQWGFSPPGPEWTRYTATAEPDSDWSVDGSSGVITGTGSHSSNLAFPIIRAEWYVETQITANSAGPNATDILFFGGDTASDFAELDIGTDGSLTFYSFIDTLTGSAGFLPSVSFGMRMQMDTLGARVKVWPLNGDEPVPWTLDGLAFGGDGIADIYMGAFMAGTYTVHFDNFGVLGTDFDTFDDRTIASGTASWGTASGGAVWTRGGSGTGRTAVTGGKGYLMCAAAPVTQIQNEEATSGFGPSDDFACLMRLAAFDTATNLPDTRVIFMSHQFAGVTWGWESTGTNTIFIQDPISGPNELAISATFWQDLVSDGAYMRFEREGSVARLKLWDETIDEPGWQLTATVALGNPIAEKISVSFVSGGGSDDIHGAWYDDIMFDDGGTEVCTEPQPNQPVENEFLGTGDGILTVYNTAYEYNAVSLQVYVAGLISEVDASDPGGRLVTILPAPPIGADVYASYRIARF